MAVSSTNIKGFSVYRNLLGVDSPNQLLFIIDNSQTIHVGDAVRVDTNGYLKPCVNTDTNILGIVAGFYDQNGQLGVFSPRIPGTAIAGATLTPDDTIATATDNTSNTAKKLSAYVIIDSGANVLYRNVTNGTVAQSNLFQYYNVVSTNAGQIDTASASNASAQWQLVQLDPDGDGNTAKGVFALNLQQLGGSITRTA